MVTSTNSNTSVMIQIIKFSCWNYAPKLVTTGLVRAVSSSAIRFSNNILEIRKYFKIIEWKEEYQHLRFPKNVSYL